MYPIALTLRGNRLKKKEHEETSYSMDMGTLANYVKSCCVLCVIACALCRCVNCRLSLHAPIYNLFGHLEFLGFCPLVDNTSSRNTFYFQPFVVWSQIPPSSTKRVGKM